MTTYISATGGAGTKEWLEATRGWTIKAYIEDFLLSQNMVYQPIIWNHLMV